MADYKVFAIVMFILTFTVFVCMIILLGVFMSKRQSEQLDDIARDHADCEGEHLDVVNSDNGLDKSELVAGSNL